MYDEEHIYFPKNVKMPTTDHLDITKHMKNLKYASNYNWKAEHLFKRVGTWFRLSNIFQVLKGSKSWNEKSMSKTSRNLPKSQPFSKLD